MSEDVCQCICAECIADEAERDALRAEVKDLRARLKAVRAEVYGTYGTTAEQDALVGRATDLRVKHWRKP